MPTPLTTAHFMRETAKKTIDRGKGKWGSSWYVSDAFWEQVLATHRTADIIIRSVLGPAREEEG